MNHSVMTFLKALEEVPQGYDLLVLGCGPASVQWPLLYKQFSAHGRSYSANEPLRTQVNVM